MPGGLGMATEQSVQGTARQHYWDVVRGFLIVLESRTMPV